MPDAVAVACGAVRLTYAELDGRASRLARVLAAAGAGPESVVGVLMERSAALVVAVLAVLKAGAAYLPVDPGVPAERTGCMLADAGARLVLADRAVEQPGEGVRVLTAGAGAGLAASDGDPSAGDGDLVMAGSARISWRT